MQKTVLLTGASGNVARELRPFLIEHFGALVLTDRVDPDGLRDGETFRKADLTILDEALIATKGVDAVVHFAGTPSEATWDQVLDKSMRTTINVLEAARINNVERFVFASSNHVNGFSPCTQKLTGNERELPDTRYAVAKVFGEASLSLYADKYGMKCMSIRIGSARDHPRFTRELSTFHHPEDLAQLIAIGVDHPDVRNDIVFGISDNARSWGDNSRAFELGYKPKHKSEDYLVSVEEGQKKQPTHPVMDDLQGGSMALAGFTGDDALVATLIKGQG